MNGVPLEPMDEVHTWPRLACCRATVAPAASIYRVADHREVELESFTIALDRYGEIGQAKWAAWRRKQQVEDSTPESFGDLVQTFIDFADPVILGDADGLRWNPTVSGWT